MRPSTLRSSSFFVSRCQRRNRAESGESGNHRSLPVFRQSGPAYFPQMTDNGRTVSLNPTDLYIKHFTAILRCNAYIYVFISIIEICYIFYDILENLGVIIRDILQSILKKVLHSIIICCILITNIFYIHVFR